MKGKERIFDKTKQTISIFCFAENNESVKYKDALEGICSNKKIDFETYYFYGDVTKKKPIISITVSDVKIRPGFKPDMCTDLNSYEKIRKFLVNIKQRKSSQD